MRVLNFSITGMVAAIAFTALTNVATAQDAAPKLPGGASWLQETYQDWNLTCQGQPQTVCAVSQQQTQRDQRVLAIELKHDGDNLSGNLVLPFGLLLDAGVTLQIDEQQPREPIGFLTCLPAGCLVRLDVDADMVNALRTGVSLKAKVQGTDQKETILPISLKGLAAALDRLKVLSGA